MNLTFTAAMPPLEHNRVYIVQVKGEPNLFYSGIWDEEANAFWHPLVTPEYSFYFKAEEVYNYEYRDDTVDERHETGPEEFGGGRED